jgi:hypothetical protein
MLLCCLPVFWIAGHVETDVLVATSSGFTQARLGWQMSRESGVSIDDERKTTKEKRQRFCCTC